MTENPVRCKYACTKALLHMPVSKRCISREIQKSIALAGSLFFAEIRHHANLHYVEQSIYPFFASIREVTLTHFGPTLAQVSVIIPINASIRYFTN